MPCRVGAEFLLYAPSRAMNVETLRAAGFGPFAKDPERAVETTGLSDPAQKSKETLDFRPEAAE
jgi:hypothetical protein